MVLVLESNGLVELTSYYKTKKVETKTVELHPQVVFVETDKTTFDGEHPEITHSAKKTKNNKKFVSTEGEATI